MKINLLEFKKVYTYVLGLKRKYKEKVLELEIGRLIPKGRATKELAADMETEIKVLESIGKPKFMVEAFCYGKENSQRLLKSGYQIYPCDAGKEMFYFDTKGQVFSDNFSGFLMAKDYRNFDLKTKPYFSCPFKGM